MNVKRITRCTLLILESAQICQQSVVGYQTFADLTFADQTFGDIWGQTFGALTNGEHKH